LIALPDFQLFQLTPSSGRWVKGFGKAFDFCGRIERDANHLNPTKSQDSVG
jgi:putative heme iron utilization protein